MTTRKAAIVTGAGGGIGRQVSIQLAARGYYLTLVSRSQDKLDQTAQLALEAAPEGVSCAVAVCDLRDTQAVKSLPTQALERFGRLDAIANIAGDAPMMPIEQITPDEWKYCIDVNLSCIVHLTAAAWPVFTSLGGGVIVNVSSMAAFDPFPGLAIYAAAKAGLNMFTHCTAQEGQAIGLRAVAIAPGAVETPMLRKLVNEQALPRDKTLDPADVARLIVGCITGDHPFESGETIKMPSPA
jgi:NAD(P)-dependent dehydrogenase (short-subunit alcohol dehydrogenase family)